MSDVESYRDLLAWQKAMDLVVLVYRLTEDFPARERFGLAFELRRTAVSVPSNVAEGHSQRHGAYLRHLVIAVGSHSELATQAELAFRLRYIIGKQRADLEDLLGQTGRLTQALLNAMRRSRPEASR
jgi:four helix bundle protein